MNQAQAPDDRRLFNLLATFNSVIVAFSGGVDSAYLAWAATQVLGRERTLCITADSPSYPDHHRKLALSLAVACGGCGDLLHSTQWETQCKDVLSSCGGGGQGGGGGGSSGCSGGGSSASSAGSSGASSTVSASSGGTGGCGDGFIQAGEECDDGNTLAGDGCEACVVVCSGLSEVKDAVTHHCYRADPGTTGTTSAAPIRGCAP